MYEGFQIQRSGIRVHECSGLQTLSGSHLTIRVVSVISLRVKEHPVEQPIVQVELNFVIFPAGAFTKIAFLVVNGG